MMKNMGSLDKWSRLIMGIGIIAAGVYFKSFWGLVGILPLMTSLVNRCPAYMPFGLSTCKVESKETEQPV
ncbi:MAG: DUF2892 domain-containing protein [Candidatus Electryonea clarkiae]|nr:DUF2892 domain-containing protein [Candidatus Electryonea clarkiae]MDP8288382.1 DUF2892 domain-containing protein [Candidatus Electryonea clarkiae]